MRPKKETQKSGKSATVTGKAVKGFTDEERVAMKERAQELKAEARTPSWPTNNGVLERTCRSTVRVGPR